ncbi:MAG: hypothetical protein JXB04_12155 [Kiritimatiellae bacterium]|nr:hypothetical protein [Kiritimatiellia bacterium]
MKSRSISGIIALVYLAVAYLADGPELTWRVAIFLVLPLACIWFSDAMGGYTGVGFGRGAITSTTPGCFVAFGGWLLLLLPVIAGLIMWIRGNG